MWVLYEVLLYLAAILLLPFYLVLGLARGKYLANLSARLGMFRTPRAEHDVWIHAVSVGETLAAKPVVDELLRLRPATSIVFTTTTITGQAQARRLFPNATVTYFPFDFSPSVRRFLDHHQPRLFATMETEIWPNVTRITRARGMRLLLANGRISDRSFPRYRFFRAVVASVLRRYDRILAREEVDRQRFIAIGAPEQIVETAGNVKFDYTRDATPLDIAPQLARLIGGRPVVMLASTREGEHELLLPELERFVRERNAFAIVAPRKPDQFDFVAGLLGQTSLTVIRRSSLIASEFAQEPATSNQQPATCFLLDSVGELARVYDFATAAFIGGSLVPTGGHNPIEAAAAGVPVCFGPNMTNFREIASLFLSAGGAVSVSSAADVFSFFGRALDDPSMRASMGSAARHAVEINRGASLRTSLRLLELLTTEASP